jgi:hypothetical protein
MRCRDEERFGLEYDLDVYNIVAVSDFNMGGAAPPCPPSPRRASPASSSGSPSKRSMDGSPSERFSHQLAKEEIEGGRAGCTRESRLRLRRFQRDKANGLTLSLSACTFAGRALSDCLRAMAMGGKGSSAFSAYF